MNIKVLIGLTTIVICFNGNTATNDNVMLGFTPDVAGKERDLETQFDSSIQRQNLRDWMKRLTARPHHLGSAYDKETAEFIAAQLRSCGFETRSEEFEVLFPTPKTRVVEMTEPER